MNGQKATEAFEKMIDLIHRRDSYSCISLCVAKSHFMFVNNTQLTYSTFAKDKNKTFKESTSLSENLGFSERIVLNDFADEVSYYRSNEKNSITEEHQFDISNVKEEKMTYSDYLKLYRVRLDSPFPYMLCLDTVTCLSFDENSRILRFKVSKKGLEDYQQYMMTTTKDTKMALAKQAMPPLFKSCQIEMSLDGDFFPTEAKIREEYTVCSLFKVPTVAYSLYKIQTFKTSVDESFVCHYDKVLEDELLKSIADKEENKKK